MVVCMKKKTKAKGRKAKQVQSPAPVAAATTTAPTVTTRPSAAPLANKRASTKRSLRYSPERQAEIIQFVQDYNEKNGRAGQASASKKYGVSALTISKWLKSSRKPAKNKAPSRPTAAAKAVRKVKGIEGTLKRMLEIQTKLEVLRAEYASLRDSL
jgi:transposase-like protein